MPLTEETYLRIAREDPDRHWELHDGELVEKPAMTFRHHDVPALLGHYLMSQLDLARYRVHINGSRLRRASTKYLIPDLAVIPLDLAAAMLDRSDVLEIYSQPLPLVVEVWSPSTGLYDVNSKLPEYMARGDIEIWRIHPFERTLTAWRRQPDGTYVESLYRDGSVRPASLPGVEIELALLFI